METLIILSIAVVCMMVINGAIEWYMDKYSDLYQVDDEWDAKVFNWLTSDDLQISVRYPHWDQVFSVETPLGDIWIANFPYSFGWNRLGGIRNRRSIRMETKMKLKARLEENGLTFHEKDRKFTYDP